MKKEQKTDSPAKIFDQYFGPAIFNPWARVLIEYADPKPGEHVLDLACGTGIVARQVAPMLGEKGKLVAIDISPTMLARGKELPPPAGAAIEWREGNAIDFARPDEKFDLVLCQQGLQYFSDRLRALSEAWRALTEKGRAFFSVWQGLENNPVNKALFEAESRHLGIPLSDLSTAYSLGNADELHMLFKKAGLTT